MSTKPDLRSVPFCLYRISSPTSSVDTPVIHSQINSSNMMHSCLTKKLRTLVSQFLRPLENAFTRLFIHLDKATWKMIYDSSRHHEPTIKNRSLLAASTCDSRLIRIKIKPFARILRAPESKLVNAFTSRRWNPLTWTTSDSTAPQLGFTTFENLPYGVLRQ